MATTATLGRTPLRRVAISSYLGTTIEYYDFLLYGTAAALVFNKVFFANLSPLVGTVVALATLAAGYVARLGGAVLFGHYGDRFGRKSVMLATMTLMGITSGLVGLLPTYDQIGVLAPLLLVLLRILQGIAVGGEYGGAVLMTVEHAGNRRRGLPGSVAAMGAHSGSILSTAAVSLVALLPEDQLLAWGWRIPFVASFGLLAVGLYFRARVAESPVFLNQEQEPDSGAPIVTLLRGQPGRVLKTVAFQVGPYAGLGVFGIFIISYAPTIGYPRSTALMAILIGIVGAALLTPVYAMLSDRVGRKPIVLFGSVATAVFAFPAFMLINVGSAPLFVFTVAGYLMIVMSPAVAVTPVLLSELFPTNVRYTAISTSYQLAQTLGSGFAPLIAASLLAASGGGTNTELVATFLLIVAVISASAVRSLPETRSRDLTDPNLASSKP
jgi:MFS family permease